MNYEKKAKSYEDLRNYIVQQKAYSATNEWGCHELTARFYEIVLLCKQFLNYDTAFKNLEKLLK